MRKKEIVVGLALCFMLLMPMFAMAKSPAPSYGEEDFEGGTVGQSYSPDPNFGWYVLKDGDAEMVYNNDNALDGTLHTDIGLPTVVTSGHTGYVLGVDTSEWDEDIISFGSNFNVRGDMQYDPYTETTINIGGSNQNWWAYVVFDGNYVKDWNGDTKFYTNKTWNYTNYGDHYIYLGIAVSSSGYYKFSIRLEDEGGNKTIFQSEWYDAQFGKAPKDGIFIEYDSVYEGLTSSEPIAPMYVDGIQYAPDSSALVYDSDLSEDEDDRNPDDKITIKSIEEGRVEFFTFFFLIGGVLLIFVWFISTQIRAEGFLRYFVTKNAWMRKYLSIIGLTMVVIGLLQYKFAFMG